MIFIYTKFHNGPLITKEDIPMYVLLFLTQLQLTQGISPLVPLVLAHCKSISISAPGVFSF